MLFLFWKSGIALLPMILLTTATTAGIVAAAATNELRGGGGGRSQESVLDHQHRDLLTAATCRNTARRDGTDRGCTDDLPLCVSSAGRFLPIRYFAGGLCARCVNLPSRRWSTDYACSSDSPLCVTADYTEPTTWYSGTLCIDDTATCYNSVSSPTDSSVDYQCSAATPLCINTDGSEPALDHSGNVCVAVQWTVYTTSDDFENSTAVNKVLFNVDTTAAADQLELKGGGITARFVWVPETALGTVVKINTDTGVVLGRYKTWPDSFGAGNGKPGGMAVDLDGSVWIANKQNVNGHGTMTHIGFEENNQCEDRNGNGIIDTSTGLTDLQAWTDDTGTRGVTTAVDECIVHFVSDLTSSQTAQISVNADNNLWISGGLLPNFDLVHGGRYDVTNSGTILETYASVGKGGAMGLIDGNGVMWSSGYSTGLLRWDAAHQPLNGTNGAPAGGGLDLAPLTAGTTWAANNNFGSSGVCFDHGTGTVWNINGNDNTAKTFASDGTYTSEFSTGGNGPTTCVADPVSGDIWIANPADNTVAHCQNDGTFVGTVSIPGYPIGLALDMSGNVWVSPYSTGVVQRIDPALNSGVGGVDATVTLTAGAAPEVYSDLTGLTTLTAPSTTGTWTIMHDSGVDAQKWGFVTWTASTPSDSTLTVQARSSSDAITYSAWQSVTFLVDLTVPDGRYLQVRVTFRRSTTNSETPILYDLSIGSVVF